MDSGIEIQTVADAIAFGKASLEMNLHSTMPEIQSAEHAYESAKMYLEMIEDILGYKKRPILVRVVDNAILSRLKACPEHGCAPEVFMIKCAHHGVFTLGCRCPDWDRHGFRGIPVREVYRSGWDADGLVREWNAAVDGAAGGKME